MSGGVTTAMDVVLALGLKPHPEGGYFRETFSDERLVEDGRPASTAIYFLLTRGQRSRWHRIDAVETWHFYAGDPLVLDVTAGDSGAVISVTLGPHIMAGHRPQAIVPAGAWQAAESVGLWTLVGCTVAPGFEFERFELAPEGWRPN
jgi:predicted cupin superfamily sugar epimerase